MAKTMNHQAFEGCFHEFNRYLKERKYSASIILSKTLRLIKQENAFTKRIYSESQMSKLCQTPVAFQFGEFWLERL